MEQEKNWNFPEEKDEQGNPAYFFKKGVDISKRLRQLQEAKNEEKEERAMTLYEVLKKYGKGTWCDICTPARRMIGTKEEIIEANSTALLKMDVFDYKYENGTLYIDM